LQLHTFYLPMLVDIHTHLNFSEDNSQIKNLSLSEAVIVFENVVSGLFSVGIHPWEIEKQDSSWLDLLKKISSNSKIVAIGECGLDKNSSTSLDKQIYFFENQIIISETIKKPIIVHCVGYFNELMEIKKKIRPQQKWIVHGFRGKPQLAQQLLKSGMSLSFGEKFNSESIKVTPFDELFIETDTSIIPLKDLYSRIASVKCCNIADLSAGFNLLKKYF